MSLDELKQILTKQQYRIEEDLGYYILNMSCDGKNFTLLDSFINEVKTYETLEAALIALLMKLGRFEEKIVLHGATRQKLSDLKEAIDDKEHAYLTISSQDGSYQEIHHVRNYKGEYLYDFGSFQPIGGYKPITEIPYTSWDEMINKLSAANADGWIVSSIG
jgi:hypothetical protein